MIDWTQINLGDLRRCVRTLGRERDAFHQAARLLLLLCCIEAVWILWLLW